MTIIVVMRMAMPIKADLARECLSKNNRDIVDKLKCGRLVMFEVDSPHIRTKLSCPE